MGRLCDELVCRSHLQRAGTVNLDPPVLRAGTLLFECSTPSTIGQHWPLRSDLLPKATVRLKTTVMLTIEQGHRGGRDQKVIREGGGVTERFSVGVEAFMMAEADAAVIMSLFHRLILFGALVCCARTDTDARANKLQR